MKKRPKRKTTSRKRASRRSSNGEPRDTALRLRARGRWLIPLPPKSKEAKLDDWPNLRFEKAELEALLRSDSNLGILLGIDPEPIIDVDLDCPEAIELAPAFLPDTEWKFGRASAPDSHWLYISAGVKTTRFDDPIARTQAEKIRSTILELRGKRAQTLIPPSTHPCGERIEATAAGEPAMVDADELVQSATLLACTALLGRHWPSEGQRHEASLALAGFLLEAGVEALVAEQVIGKAAMVAGDEEVEKRVANVGSTASRLKAGEPVSGRSKLLELLDPRIVKRLTKWLRSSGISDGSDSSDSCSPVQPPRNHVADLVRLVCEDHNAELFRDPGRDPGAFATLDTPEGRRTISVQTRAFQLLVGALGRARFGRACSRKVIEEAVDQLCGDAIYSGIQHDVHVRVARVAGAVYIDLGGSDSSAVEVDAVGWRILPESSVRFMRPSTLLAMPIPATGGALDELWSLVNVRDEGDQLLLKTWLTSVLLPDVPCPALFIHGEQGTAKSSLTRCLHTLVDPSSTMLRQLPKDTYQLAIAAANARVLSVDNLSTILQAQSDPLCRLVTGASFPVRKFHSDAEERVFAGRRALILNGIPDLARFPDLLGRALVIVLPRIRDAERRTERDLETAFSEARPRVLGALLDALSAGLRAAQFTSRPDAELDRMADFCEWGAIVAPSLGSSANEFVSALRRNRGRAEQATIEASPIVLPVKQYLFNNGRTFEGTAAELLGNLNSCDLIDEIYRKRRDWPRSPAGLSRALRREAPAIRQAGMELELDLRGRGSSPKRLLRLELGRPPRKKKARKNCQKRQNRQSKTSSPEGRKKPRAPGSVKRKVPPGTKRRSQGRGASDE